MDQKKYNIAMGWEKEIQLLYAVSLNMELGLSETDVRDLYYRFREAHSDKGYKEHLLNEARQQKIPS